MLYPLVFHPIFKERVWGGRLLEKLYHKPLPPNVPVGESWEISDRPGDASIIANGPLGGKDLSWLVHNHGPELLGSSAKPGQPFPWLIKLLDARDKLSLQVHPPAAKSAQLGGDPKTEMWYVADAAPGAELFVGLRRNVSREEFEQKIQQGTVAECFHRVAVQSGDAMFLPSGRVHAIGAGLIIFEIQQNSDTTYRVFDWNRVGLDGRPRELHIPRSLASIDFNDFEPQVVPRAFSELGSVKTRSLVDDPLFRVEEVRLPAGAPWALKPKTMQLVGLITGGLQLSSPQGAVKLAPGHFCLIPACVNETVVITEDGASFLRVEPGRSGLLKS